MLDEANTSFVNGVVTVIRWTFYIAAGLGVLHLVTNLLAWVWKNIKPTSEKNEIEKAKQHMRDLGY